MKPASEHESLSHWQSWRPSIAAGCTGTSSTSGRDEMIIPPGCCEMWRGRPAISRAALDERAPARREQLPLGVGERRELLRDLLRVPALGELREPLELGLREAERLAHVADRAARAIRRERRDERRVLAAVALGDADDQLLADVAREVEVDVGDAAHLVVQEAAEREPGLDGIDVREAGQVADDRADGAAAPRPGGSTCRGASSPAHLARALGGELEHLVVEQEEAGRGRGGRSARAPRRGGRAPALVAVRLRVPAPRTPVRRRASASRRRLAVGEVRVAVAEVGGEVEAEPLGELAGALDRVAVVGEALAHLVGPEEQDALVVAAPLALAAVERRALADRDEHVLELRGAAVVRVHVAGRDRLHAERLGELAQRRVPARVAALVRPLELDEEALASERLRDGRGRVRVADAEPVARAAGEADEALVRLEQQLERARARAAGAAGSRSRAACAPVSSRQRFA